MPGAFQTMLRTIDNNRRWRLQSLAGRVTFHEWVHGMEQVDRVRFKMKQVTPPPADGGLVAQILQCKPDLAALELRAKGGIDVGGGLMGELLHHAATGYGELVAVGRRRGSSSSERMWFSTLGGESVMSEVSVDPELAKLRSRLS